MTLNHLTFTILNLTLPNIKFENLWKKTNLATDPNRKNWKKSILHFFCFVSNEMANFSKLGKSD